MTCPACHEPLSGLDPPVCMACGWHAGLVVPPKPAAPHRWTHENASAAGRKGGAAPKRPKGLGKRAKRG